MERMQRMQRLEAASEASGESPSATPGSSASASSPSTSPRPERVCPNCGRLLLELKCKLLCPTVECGYYMSCSDFY